MLGERIGGRIAAALNRVGQTMTLRRPGDTDIDVTVKASRMGATSSATVQGQTTSTSRIRISNDEIAGQSSYTLPVRVGLDQIIDSDGKVFVIMACDTKRPGDVVVEHVLTVEG